MFSVKFDTNAQELFAREIKEVEIDIGKSVNWYINQVYRDLARQHGVRYTYTTPPGSERKVLRKRTGKALETLKQSKYARKTGNVWEAGFNIPRGSYLARFHVGEPGESERFSVNDVPSNQRYRGRVLIPLKAGLNSNGTIKALTGRQNVRVKQFQFMRKGDFTGENLSKFHKHSLIVYKQSGRRRIPLYVLATHFTVPKRVNVSQKMVKYYDDLYDRIDHEIEKQLNKKNR